MSDLPFKRVFGESHLERRCRMLFAICLSSIVFMSFWWLDHVAEDLVNGATIAGARKLADAALVRCHWVDAFEKGSTFKEVASELERDLRTQAYKWKILGLEKSPAVEKPGNPEEENIVRQLEASFQQQMRLLGNGSDALRSDAPHSTDVNNLSELSPVFMYRPVPKVHEIHYYQPVYWKSSCVRCHTGTQTDSSAPPQGDAEHLGKIAFPFRVVKVTIPDRETRQTVSMIRALFIAFGIIAVFLAMMASFVIIRLVVVKPLRRLRVVSDQMIRGQPERGVEGCVAERSESPEDFKRLLQKLTDG
jgi:two-component system sensor histidine kinase BarA